MRETPLPDSAYAAVRARVVSEIDGGRHTRRTRRWVLAWSSLVVAAACGLIAAFMLHRAVPIAAVRTAAAPLVIAKVEANEWIPARLAPRRIRRVARRIAPREPEAPIVVHMFTSDPDVVIYWVADAQVKSSKKEIVQ